MHDIVSEQCYSVPHLICSTQEAPVNASLMYQSSLGWGQDGGVPTSSRPRMHKEIAVQRCQLPVRACIREKHSHTMEPCTISCELHSEQSACVPQQRPRNFQGTHSEEPSGLPGSWRRRGAQPPVPAAHLRASSSQPSQDLENLIFKDSASRLVPVPFSSKTLPAR